MAYQKLEVSDATQGITDNIIGRSPAYFAELHNFYVDIDKNPKVRPGSLVEGANDTLGKSSSGSKMFLVKNLNINSSPYRVINSTGAKFYYTNGSSWVELTGPGSASLFDSTHSSATDNRVCNTTWNNHKIFSSTSFTQYPQVVFDDSGTLKLRTLGLPTPTNITSAHITYTAGTTNYYIYYFVWKYTYTTGGRTFIIRSAPLRIQIGTTGSPPSKVVPPALAALSNTSAPVTHYDTSSSNLVMECYRTIANGVTAYLVDTITNPNITGVDSASTRFDDSLSDATLDDNQIAYFNAGTPERLAPPICKFFHVTERGTGYAGYYLDTDGSTIRNGIRQSIPGEPYAMPGDFYDTLDADVTGISSFRGVPIFFTRDATYKAESEFLEDGTGLFKVRKISETIGCINHLSIVQTEYGVFFASESGFFWSDGYTVRTISDEIKERYKDYYPNETAELNIRGAYDVKRQLLVWTYRETSNSHALFVFHRRFGIKEDGVFTTWGGRATTPNFNGELIYPNTLPTTITESFRCDDVLYADDTLYRADLNGYCFYFDEDTQTDPRIVTTDNISSWKTNHIYYNLKTSALDFGSAMIRKLQPYVTFVFRNTSNISVQPELERDLDTIFRVLKPIKHTGSFAWGTTGVLWGDTSLWDSVSNIFIETRRARAPGLRCTYRTLRLTNAFTVIKKSDDMGLADVSGTTSKSVLLQEASSYDWPSDCLDYYISFSDDDYTKHYLVTARSADTLTISDASQLAPTGTGLEWQLKGFEKGAVLDVQSMTFPFLPISDSITAFHAGDEGGNS